jgi:hypothetical protein
VNKIIDGCLEAAGQFLNRLGERLCRAGLWCWDEVDDRQNRRIDRAVFYTDEESAAFTTPDTEAPATLEKQKESA